VVKRTTIARGPAGYGALARAVVVGVLSLVSLAACSTILPGSGPTSDEIVTSGMVSGSRWFELFDVDASTLEQLKRRPSARLSKFADGQGPQEPLIGVGDVIKVTIWEAAPGGLFTSQVNLSMGAGSQSVTIPDQVVTQEGTISVPFVGAPKVQGQTVRAVEKMLRRSLTGKAMDPQVLVTVVRSSSSAVTVTGDAIGGAQLPLGPNGFRILDAVAAVGGIKSPVNETFVGLSRAGRQEEVPFAVLLNDPNENVFLRPRDVLSVMRKPVTFTVLGAAGRNADINFDGPSLSLAQALGKAGGFIDLRADASGVFIFRREEAKDVIAMGRSTPLTALGGPVPVIYRVDLSGANGLIAAQAFRMEPGDLVYVSNAPATEFEKFIRLIGATRSVIQ
jgi:polysaccharide export outer membrane protein